MLPFVYRPLSIYIEGWEGCYRLLEVFSLINGLRKQLSARPDEMDIGKLAPVFVPASFFRSDNWQGPFQRLRSPEIGLTWAVLLPKNGMRYVDAAMKQHWEELGIDWKEVALRNLAKHTGERPGTHAMNRADGTPYSISMMHPDGIGPSRLLFRDKLSELFPAGYRVALPEMSCAFAISADVTVKERQTLEPLIEGCYRNGARQLAPGMHDPEELDALI